MKLKDIKNEDFVNYKKPSMFLVFPYCDFKCCRECGKDLCQNMEVIKYPTIDIEARKVVERYLDNPITKAIVCGGLEPLDSFDDLLEFVKELRKYSNDTVVVYTGYYKNEIEVQLEQLKEYNNIIIKFGRFVPDKESHFDEVLGVNLVNPEQYAEKIS